MKFFELFKRKSPLLETHGPAPAPPAPTVCEGEVLDHVILRYLLKTLSGYNEYSISISGIKLPQIEKEQAEITRLRAWALAQNMDPKVYKAYTKWLDHFWRGSEEARTALARRAPSPSDEEMRAFRAQSALRDKMVEQCLQAGTVPVPPR